MKNILLFALLTYTGLTTSAQELDTSSFKKDFEILKTVLTEIHPSLYRFTPKERFQEVLDSIDVVLNQDVTPLQFFRIASKVESLVRESHFYIEPSDQLLQASLTSNLFPFDVWIEDEKLIITKSNSEKYADFIGLDIRAINGKPVSRILQIIENSAGLKSGFNNAALKDKLSQFNNFSLAYYFYVDTSSQFEIEYLDSNNSQAKSLISGTQYSSNQEVFPKFHEESNPPFHLQINEEKSIAKLMVSTFAHWTVSLTLKDYQKFFKDCFELINRKKIRSLIIDVRSNRGGNDINAAELLSYFIKEDFKVYRYAKTKTLDFDQIDKLVDFEKSYLIPKWFSKTDSGFYLKEKKFEFLKTHQVKKKNHFDGNVYILSGGGSRSATNSFLALAKTYKLASIIGTESGGVFEDVDNGYGIKFTLPYSKIKVNCPFMSMKLSSENGDRTRGVRPHYLVPKSKQDILGNSDSQLTFTYNLIKKRDQNSD